LLLQQQLPLLLNLAVLAADDAASYLFTRAVRRRVRLSVCPSTTWTAVPPASRL